MAHGPAVHRSPWRFDWLSRNVFPHAPAWLLDLVVPVRIIGTTLDDTDGRVYGADGFAQLAPASGNFAAFVFRANGVHVEVLHVDAWARDQNSRASIYRWERVRVRDGRGSTWPCPARA